MIHEARRCLLTWCCCVLVVTYRRKLPVESLSQVENPWKGITLNRCIALAMIIVVVSSGVEQVQGNNSYYDFPWTLTTKCSTSPCKNCKDIRQNRIQYCNSVLGYICILLCIPMYSISGVIDALCMQFSSTWFYSILLYFRGPGYLAGGGGWPECDGRNWSGS